MAVNHRGTINYNGALTTSSANEPYSNIVGMAVDDVLFLAVTSRDSVGAGSIAVSDGEVGNVWVKIANSTDHKATLWYKRVAADTIGRSCQITGGVGSVSGRLRAFSGADTGATPYTNIVVEPNASGDESHADFTPDFADSMLCATVHNYGNDNAVTSPAFATAGSMTVGVAATVGFAESLSTGGSDCATAFGYILQAGGPSATGAFTWLQTNGATYSITWAIKPAASVAPIKFNPLNIGQAIHRASYW